MIYINTYSNIIYQTSQQRCTRLLCILKEKRECPTAAWNISLRVKKNTFYLKKYISVNICLSGTEMEMPANVKKWRNKHSKKAQDAPGSGTEYTLPGTGYTVPGTEYTVPGTGYGLNRSGQTFQSSSTQDTPRSDTAFHFVARYFPSTISSIAFIHTEYRLNLLIGVENPRTLI